VPQARPVRAGRQRRPGGREEEGEIGEQ
jgi:hypothetical protein